MTTIVVTNVGPFGQMSNQAVRAIFALDSQIKRIQAAQAAAASGYAGTAGTEFENGTQFSVVPAGAAGTQGLAWQFAFGTLNTAWNTFMQSAQASLTALDNGG